MFIPFLAVAAVATTFAALGAMSVKIAVLTALLQAMSVAFLAVGFDPCGPRTAFAPLNDLDMGLVECELWAYGFASRFLWENSSD